MEPIEAPNKYVLCYQLGVKENLLKFARQLGIEKGLHLIIIPTNEYTCAQPESVRSLSPEHFLYLVKNASYVVTDSFHGTIFSINFGVQFFSFSKVVGSLETFDNIRIVEILESFNIQERFIEGKESQDLPANIDYASLNKELQKRRESSQIIINRIVETA